VCASILYWGHAPHEFSKIGCSGITSGAVLSKTAIEIKDKATFLVFFNFLIFIVVTHVAKHKDPRFISVKPTPLLEPLVLK